VSLGCVWDGGSTRGQDRGGWVRGKRTWGGPGLEIDAGQQRWLRSRGAGGRRTRWLSFVVSCLEVFGFISRGLRIKRWRNAGDALSVCRRGEMTTWPLGWPVDRHRGDTFGTELITPLARRMFLGFGCGGLWVGWMGCCSDRLVAQSGQIGVTAPATLGGDGGYARGGSAVRVGGR